MKICLTGSTGFLGWAFLRAGRAIEWGLPVRRVIDEVDLPWNVLEAFDEVSVTTYLDEGRFEAVIHVMAMADPGACERDPDLSYQVNVELPVILARYCASRDIPFVHFSTDLVFDGAQAPYTERCEPRPLSRYGRQKAESEKRVLLENNEAWVCRLPLLYGESGAWTRNGLRDVLEDLSAGRRAKLFTDEYRTPVRTKRVAEFVLEQLGQQNGLMNMGGAQRLSRFEMGQQLWEVFGRGEAPIEAVQQEDLHLSPPRPADVSLNSGFALDQGFSPPSFDEELLLIKKNGGWDSLLVP